MISKSELAAKTGLSVMTLDRIEKGKPYRLDTKRKIVEALGFNPWLDNDRSPSHQRQESWTDKLSLLKFHNCTKEERNNHYATFYIWHFLP